MASAGLHWQGSVYIMKQSFVPPLLDQKGGSHAEGCPQEAHARGDFIRRLNAAAELQHAMFQMKVLGIVREKIYAPLNSMLVKMQNRLLRIG